MNKKEIQKRVNDLNEQGGWNCYFKFPHDVVTRQNHIDSPGYNLNKWPRLKVILDDIGLEDKTVVDIGCGDGFCTFKFLDKKVRSIKGIDFSTTSIKNAKKNKKILGLKKKNYF